MLDAAAVPLANPTPKVLSTVHRWKIFGYLGVLIVLLSMGHPAGAVIDIPLNFLLKNKLHLSEQQLSNFRLIAAIPLYLSFVFGLLRDSVNPLGMGDRGFVIVFGAITAALYVIITLFDPHYTILLIGILVLRMSFLFVLSAQNGLTSALGQQHLMSGQISAAWNIFLSLCGVCALVLGGYMSDLLEGETSNQSMRILFLIGAVAMTAIALYGIWRPPSVFDHVAAERPVAPDLLGDIKKLAKHRAVYSAFLIWLLWNFAPGSDTALMYFMQNTLHANDAMWGLWNAMFAASFIPTYFLFGFLCKRYSLRVLLIWGTVAAIPQMIPLVFIHSLSGALVVAVPIGLMGGVATAAYLDLIIRSCPPGLQGTTLMMSFSLAVISVRFGDRLGTAIFHRTGDFEACVIAITLVYALILPVLLLIPKDVVATSDGVSLPP